MGVYLALRLKSKAGMAIKMDWGGLRQHISAIYISPILPHDQYAENHLDLDRPRRGCFCPKVSPPRRLRTNKQCRME